MTRHRSTLSTRGGHPTPRGPVTGQPSHLLHVPPAHRWLAGVTLALIAAICLRSGSPHRAVASPPPPPTPAVVIVAPEELADAALAWSQYRQSQGWRVDRLTAAPEERSDPSRLRDRIREQSAALLAAGSSRVAVLLLGDADSIPPFRFAQPDPRLVDRADREFASDHPYQRLDDGDELPDLALGRVPARSAEEAGAVLEKIRRYESPPADANGAWRSRLTFVAGEGRFGPADAVLESLFRSLIERMVPECFELSMTYASPTSVYCPPPSQMERIVAGRFAEPALLVNYLGHGHARGLDSMRWRGAKVPLLTLASMPAFEAPRESLPIAFFGCCSVGWFDRARGEPSLAERLLAAPGGPVAIIAGSRPTHPYGTAILQKDLARRLLSERVATVGELDLEATRSMLLPDSDDAALDLIAGPLATVSNWPCTLTELRLMHVRMYNLLGDPCTRIALPPKTAGTLRLDGRTLRGEVEGMAEGDVHVVLETAREASAAGVLAPAGADSADLEARALDNYPRANERALWRASATVRDGRYAVELPDPLPDGAAIARCAIHGTGADGGPVEAVDAIRLAQPGR